MSARIPFTTATRGISTRAPFRTRKPKLGAEPRSTLPSTSSPTATSTPPLSALQAGESSLRTHVPPPSLLQHHPTPTHYAITLHRSAIGLPPRTLATLEALGIHRRMQTVYHRFAPDIAGKILAVKELVEVRNVPESQVRTPEQAREERKAVRGYEVIQRARPSGAVKLSQALHVQRRKEASQTDRQGLTGLEE